jgi:hypothetical protein
MIAIDPPVRILIFSLASEGPSTHAPTRFIAAGHLRATQQMRFATARRLAAGEDNVLAT